MKVAANPRARTLAFGGVFVAAFLYFVYPTPYQVYGKYPDLARLNRFTGAVEKSTPSGWRSITELQKEENDRLLAFEENRKKEEALEKQQTKERAEGRELEAVKLGRKGQYKATMKIALIKSKCFWEMDIKPLDNVLSEAIDDLGNRLFEPKLTNESGMQIENLEVEEWSRVVGENGKYAGLSFSGYTIMTSEEYEAIKGFTCRWTGDF